MEKRLVRFKSGRHSGCFHLIDRLTQCRRKAFADFVGPAIFRPLNEDAIISNNLIYLGCGQRERGPITPLAEYKNLSPTLEALLPASLE